MSERLVCNNNDMALYKSMYMYIYFIVLSCVSLPSVSDLINEYSFSILAVAFLRGRAWRTWPDPRIRSPQVAPFPTFHALACNVSCTTGIVVPRVV